MTHANANRIQRFSKKLLMASTALVAAGAVALTAHPAQAKDVGQYDVWEFENTAPVASSQGYVKYQGARIVDNLTQEDIGTLGQVDIDSPLTVAYGVESGAMQILGSLNSTGSVYILDTNGVYFGKDSQIDVGSLVASTGQLDLGALDDGRVVLSNLGAGTIENAGSITAAQAGLVAFVAPTVKNSGVINAKLGKVAFAAGEKVTIDLYGDQLVEIAAGDELTNALLENTGTISAEGGQVVMSARAAKNAVDNIINMEGVINASSATVKGGKIILDGGDAGLVNVAGTIEAKGTDGGEVVVDAQNTLFTQTSTVDVSANDITSGLAGSAVLWGRDNAIYAGDITAYGENGFVETSGGNLGVYGNVNMGAGSEWLLDPTNIEIVSFANLDDADILAAFSVIGSAGPGGAASVSFSPADPVDPVLPPGSVGDSGDSPLDGLGNQDSLFYVHDKIINDALNNGTNVTLRTAAEGSKDGDIILRADAAILKTGGADSTFTLEAHDDITINGTIGATGDGVLNVILTADFDGADDPADIFINNSVETGGGDFTGNASARFKVNAGGSVDAQGGNIVLNNERAFQSTNADTIRTSGTGTITMRQNNLNNGGSLQNAINAVENTGTGLNTITASAGTYNEAIEIYENNFLVKGANAGIAGNATRGAESKIVPNSPGFLITSNNVTVDGFEVVGGEIGIHIKGGDDVTVQNNYIHGQRHPAATGTNPGSLGTGDGILVTDHADKTQIFSNLVEDTDDESFQAFQASNLIVDGNVFDNRDTEDANGNNAIELNQVSGDSYLINNIVYSGFLNGIAVKNSNGVDVGRFANGNEIVGRGVDETAISITNSTNTDIFSNDITNAGANGILVNPSDDVEVSDNRIDNVGGDGIRVEGGTGHVIDENTITSAAFDGIHIEDFGTAWISHNIIGISDPEGSVFASGDDGIEAVNGEYVSIYGNNIFGAGFHDEGFADDFGADGIHVRNVSGYEGPELPLGDGAGYAFSPADADIYSNTIAFTMDDGVEILGQNEGETAYVYENNIGHIGYEAPILGTEGGDYIGVKLSGITESEIYGNVISSVVNDGIQVSFGDYTGIYDNRIALVGGDGIEVNNMRGGRAADSVPFVVGTPTYASYEGAVEVTGNEIALTGENGIFVHYSGATRIIQNDIFMAGIGADNVIDEVNTTASIVAGDFFPFATARLATEEIVDDIEDIDPSFTLEWGNGDGILVENVYGTKGDSLYRSAGNIVESHETPDASISNSWSVIIQGNDIDYTGGDGIEVRNSGATLIGGEAEEEANTIFQAGIDETVINGASGFGDLVSKGPFAEGSGRETLWTSEGNAWSGDDLNLIIETHVEFDSVMHDRNGFDGIRVSGVYENGGFIRAGFDSETEGSEEEGSYYGYAVNIIGNDIDTTGDDGIEVINSGSVLIKGNTVSNAGYGEDEDYGSGDFYGADGIHVRNVNTFYNYKDGEPVTKASVGNAGREGIDVYSVVIDGNTVDTTADDGIEVVGETGNDKRFVVRTEDSEIGNIGTGRTLIINNDVVASGNGVGAYDGYGSDGIHVRGVTPEPVQVKREESEFEEGESFTVNTTLSTGIFSQNSDNDGFIVKVIGNSVDQTDDDGIQILDSGNSLIDDNIITNIGLSEDSRAFADYDNEADGIHVRNGFVERYNSVYNARARLSQLSESDEVRIVESTVESTNDSDGLYFLNTKTEITNNTINIVSDDGIRVQGVTDVLVANNVITNVKDDGIEITGYADGFDEFSEGRPILFGGSLGSTLVEPTFNVRILNNTVTNSDDNGIKVEDFDTATLSGNNVTNSGDDGIDIESTDFITVNGNVVSNSNDVGILIDGLENGNVILSGNTLNNNPIHVRFESGRVDLTGAGNNFNGGGVGIQFDGPLVSLIDNDPEDEFDGTLGAQTFTGQSGFYVELTNGALFNPGQPGFYNALNSSFDGLTPADTDGILTGAQLAFLEGKFQHFNDLDTLGLFFFGALDPIDQEDIFNSFGAFNAGPGVAGVTITGLPTISAAQTAALLNQLTPAAGGEGEPSAEDVAGIEPAAGSQNVGCWSDAVNAIDSGATVNYDFDSSFEGALSDTAACGAQTASAAQ